MKSIAQEYARVLALNAGLSGSTYFSNEHKDDREWHILGSAHAAYFRAQRSFPSHADKRQSPDFHLFDATAYFEHALEVTMVIPPDHKVHRHHREWEASGSKPMDHPYPGYRAHWDWLRQSIGAKLNLPYIRGCGLLVYFDVSLHDTVERSPDDFLASVSVESNRHPKEDFGVTNIRSSGVKSILILSADMRALVEIYPHLDVISK